MACLVSIAFPLTRHPASIRALRHLWLASRESNKTLIDQRCCLRIWGMARLKLLFFAIVFSSIDL